MNKAGPTITEYCPPRNLRRLAAATVTQAIKDLHNQQDAIRAVTALLWLTAPRSSLQTFLDVIDIDAADLDIFGLLSTGAARRLLKKL